MKRSFAVKALSLCVLSIVVASGCRATAHDTPEEAAPVAVTVAPVRLADVPASFEAGGIVRARSVAHVASRLLAPVAAVHVRAGDRVRRGSRLVTLDAREAAANDARAIATLAGSREAVTAAEGAVRSAEANLVLARATSQRLERLHERRSATMQERDRTAAGLEAAEGQLQSARANLLAATAARQAALAAREASSVVASYAMLIAPFDGVVTARRVDPGDMASPGVPLLTLEDPASFRAEVTVDEARIRTVVPGQAAEIANDEGRDDLRWLKTTVSEIARIDSDAHAFLVKLDLPTTAGLRSGMFVRARFAGPSRRTLVVPASAAIRRGQLTFVFVVDADGRARLRPISPGATVGEDALEVLAGLAEGARVIERAPASLADGTRVREERR